MTTRKTKHPLRRVREQMGLSQSQFAERVGLRQTHVCNYENGAENMGAQVALRIADRARKAMNDAGVDVEMLLRGRMMRRRTTG